MFVAIACELASEKHRDEVYALLVQYGFSAVQKDLYESVSIRAELLPRLKRDIDRRTDYYDKIKLFQYPMDGQFVVTALSEKKWRKIIMKA
ncbi:MAG: CRISPR-associated protein Cas2 [Spirochaetales bacterium]|nr:CRISPR-associated protein Cas2 [Spirochaetales bacterium]